MTQAATRGREAAAAVLGPRLENDVHSRLNPTLVGYVASPRSTAEVQEFVRFAASTGRSVSVAGGRHAMGGQQFAADGLHIDATELCGLVDFDPRRGLVEVGAGITWPPLLDMLGRLQPGEPRPWTIRQKQTGADRLTLGGALSANVHGRGLAMAPFVGDIESFTLVDADGEAHRASRDENPELFALAIGGYGLFGIVTTVRVRLARRCTLRRDVEVVSADELPASFRQRVDAGYQFGDWQFAIDPTRSDFLRLGIFSCYQPVDDAPVPPEQRSLSETDWLRLLALAHRDKHAGFQMYARHYLATHGQLYHSDACQMATYLDDYHRRLGAPACHGSEMITELYCAPDDLPRVLAAAAAALRAHSADVIYGTVRVARQDTETFLPWATRDTAGIIINLHVEHTPDGRARAGAAFRALIDAAIAFGGSYYLTYHRFASADQVLACYPRFPEFLARKRRFDPKERFQSEWYRHYAGLIGT